MQQLREQMVREQIKSRDITDARVIEAMIKVERHKFVPGHSISAAYEDHPLPIGHGQTISQPYIVALMSQLCRLTGTEKVLEIGTGSGYQTAILACLARTVYTIEIIEPLAKNAQKKLKDSGYTNIETRLGDGHNGWPEEAPFDAIILTASPAKIPQMLIDQLAVNGILVAPEGEFMQELVTIEKTANSTIRSGITYVRFVPMVHGTNSN